MAYVKKDYTRRSERIMFRTTKDFKEKLEKLAAEDHRSLSEFILISLMDYFKEVDTDE